MQIHVERIPASPLVFMRRTGAYGEQNFKLMQDMKAWIQAHNLWNESGTIYGIAQDNIATTPPEQCRYDVCLATEQVFEDDTVQRGTLPAGTYLVCEIPHTPDAVQHFWGSIGEVLAKEGKQIDECCPILERYQFALVEKGCCEFCIPVL